MKKYIQIGTKEDGSPVQFDIARLILTRLLICANSGGGKSWLLRLIAELLFDVMPVIIFDIEGEFVTLRDKFDFVLVGPDGAPGDPHDKMDVRDENLKAMCQRCHLRYDIVEHVKNAKLTREKKMWKNQLELIPGTAHQSTK